MSTNTTYEIALVVVTSIWIVNVLVLVKLLFPQKTKLAFYVLTGLIGSEFLVVPLLSAFGLVSSRYADMIGPGEVQLAVFTLVMGLFMFTTGYVVWVALHNTRSSRQVSPQVHDKPPRISWSTSKARIAAWALLGLSIGSFIIYAHAWGGLEIYLRNFFFFRQQAPESAAGVLKWFVQVGVVGSTFLWTNYLLKRNKYELLGAAFHSLVSIVLILLLGGRGDVLLAVLSLVTASYLVQTNIMLPSRGQAARFGFRSLRKAVRIAIGGIALVTFLGYYKGLAMLVPYGRWEEVAIFLRNRTSELLEYVLSEFYNKDMLLAFVSNASVTDFRYGEYLMQGIIGILPSSILGIPSYPTFGAQAQAFLGWGLAPTPPGLFSALYWDAGLVGVFFGMLVFGLVVGIVDCRISTDRSIATALIGAFVIWVFLFEIMRHAEYARSSVKLLTKLIPLVVALGWIQQKRSERLNDRGPITDQ